MYGKTQKDGDRPDRVEAPVEQDPGRNPKDEQAKSRGGEERHQMVSHRQRQDERHEDQKVVITALAEVLTPVKGQPGEECDGHERDRVDLLVHVGLVPDGEGGRTHDHGGDRADEAEPPIVREKRKNVMDRQEPESVGHTAHEGREKVDPCRNREPQGRKEKLPGSRHQHEKRISGWMGDSEDVRRRDVFAGIPECGRR